MACLSSLGMLEAKGLGCMSSSLSFMVCSLLVMEVGSLPGVPVNFLYTQVHLSSNFSKNSVGSGMSLGVGANFGPSSRALV